MAHDDEDEPPGAPGAPPPPNRSPYYRLPSPEDDDGDDGEAPRPYTPPALPYGAPPPASRPYAAPPPYQPYAQPPLTWPHPPEAAAPPPTAPPPTAPPPPPTYEQPYAQPPPPPPAPPTYAQPYAQPPPVAPEGGGPGGSNAWWRRWWAISLFTVVGIVVLLGVIGAVAGDPDDDDSGAPTVTSRRSRPPTTEATATTASRGPADTGAKGVGVVDGSGVAVGGVGAVLEVGDGARARVLSVTAAAEPLDDFSAPEPGSTLTRLDVELCAGTERLNVNPFYWSATLDDGSSVQPMFTGRELQSLGLAPGACTRGLLDLTVVDGRSVSTVVLGDDLLRPAARWDVAAPAVAVGGPLTAAVPIEPAPLGKPVIGPDGATIVLHGVEPEAAPVDDFLGPDEGHTLTRLEVELCAGSGSLPANPFYWYGRQDDGVTVGASFLSQGLALDDLVAGVCARGTVDLEVAVGTRIVEVIWVDQILDEGGRWAVA